MQFISNKFPKITDKILFLHRHEKQNNFHFSFQSYTIFSASKIAAEYMTKTFLFFTINLVNFINRNLLRGK